MSRFRDFQPGTTVRLTGTFLRNTGQVAGGEGRKRWTVEPCACELCRRGDFVAVNEPTVFEHFTPEELAEVPGRKWRHFNKENLSIVGQLDHRDTP